MESLPAGRVCYPSKYTSLKVYSTDQKKPNREWERERNGYRTGTRMGTGTERILNVYKTGMERIQNDN